MKIWDSVYIYYLSNYINCFKTRLFIWLLNAILKPEYSTTGLRFMTLIPKLFTFCCVQKILGSLGDTTTEIRFKRNNCTDDGYPLIWMHFSTLVFLLWRGAVVWWAYSSCISLTAPRVEGSNPLPDIPFWRMYRFGWRRWRARAGVRPRTCKARRTGATVKAFRSGAATRNASVRLSKLIKWWTPIMDWHGEKNCKL